MNDLEAIVVDNVTSPLNLCPASDPTPVIRALVESVISGNAAMMADLAEMAEGNYTGRHCQAWLDGRRKG